MTTQPAQLVCNHCRGPLRGSFRIERRNANGNLTAAANLCSVPCVLQWCVEYAKHVGLQGAVRARTMIDQVLDLFR